MRLPYRFLPLLVIAVMVGFGASVGLSVAASGPAMNLVAPALTSGSTALIPPANAAYAQSITTADTVIFKSASAGGSQIDGCTAFTISNEGAVDLYVNVRGHHAVDGSDNPTEYGKIPAGTTVTFTVRCDSSRPNLQINRITAKSATGTATVSYMVTERF